MIERGEKERAAMPSPFERVARTTRGAEMIRVDEKGVHLTYPSQE